MKENFRGVSIIHSDVLASLALVVESVCRKNTRMPTLQWNVHHAPSAGIDMVAYPSASVARKGLGFCSAPLPMRMSMP